MSNFRYFFKRLSEEVERNRFLRGGGPILRVSVADSQALPFLVLSMVQHRDVLPYLIALKSFIRYVNPQKIVVVCDPTITKDDRQLLRSQIPMIELRNAAEFKHDDIPEGGCWERLYAISSYAVDEYVVQLDADTVTMTDPQEVRAAILSRKGFVLGESVEQQILSLKATSNAAEPFAGATDCHIQHLAEARMNALGYPEHMLYVRGCAGFTGFVPDAHMRENMLEFSRRMFSVFGDRWRSWGTEQVASNFIVANQPGTSVLPFPRYGTPDVSGFDDAFIHFIGTMRFTGPKYRKAAIRVISELR